VRVFWLERTALVRVALRRLTWKDEYPCPNYAYGHDASTVILSEAAEALWIEQLADGTHRIRETRIAPADPRWPSTCAACGAPFPAAAFSQVGAEPLFRGAPDGRRYTLRDAPTGAMWDATWLHGHGHSSSRWWQGDDGISLVVKLPNGNEWMPDSRASNCTLPDDHVHRCWIRHGDPRTGHIHVDKDGVTCSAGAGSIVSGGWHGFLHHDELVAC